MTSHPISDFARLSFKLMDVKLLAIIHYSDVLMKSDLQLMVYLKLIILNSSLRKFAELFL